MKGPGQVSFPDFQGINVRAVAWKKAKHSALSQRIEPERIPKMRSALRKNRNTVDWVQSHLAIFCLYRLYRLLEFLSYSMYQ
jgi:hypothetical protein